MTHILLIANAPVPSRNGPPSNRAHERQKQRGKKGGQKMGQNVRATILRKALSWGTGFLAQNQFDLQNGPCREGTTINVWSCAWMVSQILAKKRPGTCLGISLGGVYEWQSVCPCKGHCGKRTDMLCYLSYAHDNQAQNACNLSGFKKALLQNPRKMIRGRIFREMIRVSARKSELQAKSRSYSPKVGVTVGQTPRI